MYCCYQLRGAVGGGFAKWGGVEGGETKKNENELAIFIEFWKASMFKILQHAIDYIAAIGQFLFIIFPVECATNSDIFQTTNSDIKM